MPLLKITSRIVCILSLSLSIFSARASSVEESTKYLPVGTNLSFIAQPVGSKTPSVDYQGQQMALPASTQKVVTALAALLQLGKDYRFTTTLESDANISEGALEGNLIARFVGDPMLTRTQLRNMVNTLKQSGIKQINGDLIIDISIFASHDKAPGWAWNDMTQCFSSPPSAAIVDKNCFSVSLYSAGQPGELAFVKVPSFYPVNVFSEVKTLAKGSPESKYCELDVIPGDLNRYTLTGCLTQRTEALPLAFAIQNGASYAGAILKKELSIAGIELKGYIRRQSTPQQTEKILSFNQSVPLNNMLTIMLKKSDNMIADAVFRTLGHRYFNVPGTWRAGSDAVHQILKQKAGIDLGNTVIVDGSGLSRHNLITASTMMEVLQFIAQNNNELDFISMLPKAGYDGTLAYRPGLHEAGMDGKIFAKTGSLQGVYNLVGFMTAASGQQIAFVQFISAYSVSPEDQRTRRVPLSRFENHLFKSLYQKH
ncbi:serine-type D-Ala-D-Ala carboxypeptidase [Xenorhabdus sp. 42]|uniref:Serine-type D-Ala-D-Ala carboxypeptidase n=1 Tax=Xenorhabdus szentirmaii TaxID=290112 RepID=A0AAW3YSD6_9GAMM|nr:MULTISPECIES: serine-type D-Ala-D-Ala carboxypeptidase [unclassified Xenorhabdus]MBD2791295.1 serine-type D-Ala-D-Ala carboxypeptidase [Xenorhabdus sp. CUL]MBD2799944.1 serine-type D-Ala-D-Ala carboxypeptidase [Xenorhabdus sp. M]MBD2803356.1 serine-type D-Ala-D-Ala carboxypeptidase [Xenorhabdus sp. ZM]MBD2821383.1 serine-type D-Ala-D-Ala carboxypeptidase [Xenorhabdus sp. 42]MBD2825057.1 serine-type D-Ala-D-Ala carboxypeptidase [Xenorhabdus sp. 5]